MHKPIRVTAHPLTPIITDRLMPIDGILLFYAMQERYGRQQATLPGEITAPLVDLPLERRGNGSEWYYAASMAEWVDLCQGKSFWTKRIYKKGVERLVDFNGRRGKVIVEEGRYKGYQMPVFYLHATRIHWYAVGDIDAVRSLLSACTHIGKKTAYGWGRVLWSVEQWHSDWSEWRDDTQMRALPADGGILYGIRPPYWLPENQTMCEMPN